MYQPLIEAIRAEMQTGKRSQSQMARSLSISQAMLSYILSGDRGIGGVTLARIMDRRPEWWPLLNGSNNRPTGSSHSGKEDGPGAA